MSTLKIRYLRKITRPSLVILGGIAAYIVALLSNGPTWFNTPKIVAGLVMAFCILGSSLWHYGSRSDVYARKHWDPIYIKKPKLFILIGSLLFAVSIFLAWKFLPTSCLVIAIVNFLIIVFYARVLDRYWPWKNLSIAGICITPILIGWFSGHSLHPMVPPIIVAAFFFYLAREIVKDVVDIEANRGKRFTMVMDIGTSAALKVGGISIIISVMILLYSLNFAPQTTWVRSSCHLGSLYLLFFAVLFLCGKNIKQKYVLMDWGVALILFSLLGVRATMY